MPFETISSVPVLPSSGRSRWILSCLWLVVIVVLASYSATLTSYLAVDVRGAPFTSLYDVIPCSSYPIWIDTDTMLGKLFRVCKMLSSVISYDSPNTEVAKHLTPIHSFNIIQSNLLIVSGSCSNNVNRFRFDRIQTTIITSASGRE